MLWTVSRPCLTYVLVVDAAAAAAIALTATLVPIAPHHLIWFGILAIASVAHLELTLSIERLRELHTEGHTYTNLKSIWTFAGLLVLPPPLVAILIALTYGHVWFRVSRRIVPHRWVFSACNVVLASTAGGFVLVTMTDSYASLPAGWTGFSVVVLAAAARWIVNRILTSIAVILMYPGTTTLRGSLGPATDNFIEYGALALGVVVARTMDDPAYLLVLVIPILVVHRGLMLRQFEHAAHRDGTTGLHNAGFWFELAGKSLARAEHQQTTAGLLMVHLDEYHKLAALHGQRVADAVLRRVAELIKAEVRRDDLAGRLTGEDLVLLLYDVSASDLSAVAERIRQAVGQLDIDFAGPEVVRGPGGLTVSIGGSIFPDNATTLDALIAVC